MAIKELKFAESEFSGQDIASLPDRPNDAGMTAAQLKARFDQIGKVMIALGRYNDLIDALTAQAAAGELGAVNIEGLEGVTVQELLEALKAYEDAHRERQDNPHGVTKAQLGLENVDNTPDAQKPVSEAQQAAIDALEERVLTKENTGEYTPTAPYHPATKEYVDQTALEAGAVRSVFGRAGAVTAQAGDYTAEMVGAAPATHASQHAANGSDPITPTDIGASVGVGKRILPGDDLNNYVTDGLYHIYSADSSSVANVPVAMALYVKVFRFDNLSTDIGRFVQIAYQANNINNPKMFYRFGSSSSGFSGWATLYDSHNKPTGSYTGNGSATSRTIATGAIGNNVLIESTNGCAILTGNCWIGWTPTSAKYGMYSTAHGNNGTITLATSDALLNANGVEYRYQYL